MADDALLAVRAVRKDTEAQIRLDEEYRSMHAWTAGIDADGNSHGQVVTSTISGRRLRWAIDDPPEDTRE